MRTTTKHEPPTRPTVKPLPEIVDKEHRTFQVSEHFNPRVSLQDPCKFQAPLGTERHLQDCRAHELAHIRFTPTDETPSEYARLAEVPELYLQACEDFRVNRRAKAVGVHLDSLSNPAGLEAHLAIMLDSAPVDFLACYAVARTDVRAERILIERVFNTTPKGQAALTLAGNVRTSITVHIALDFDAAIAGAQYLQSIFNTAAALTAPPKGSCKFDALPPLDLSDLETLKGVMACVGRMPGLHESTRWGKMNIINPPRFTPCATFVKGLRPRATDSGLVPLAVHRLPTDGLIFKHKAKSKYGGAVLIDMSGSMSLPFEAVTKWLQTKPLATVALYSGEDLKGNLTVLAKDGLRTNDATAHPNHNGNIIDGPALHWLARQPGPRAWVSDGGTTGIYDGGYGSAECRALCTVHRIKQIRFGQLANGAWPPKD